MSLQRSKIVKARRYRRCCECGAPIARGDRYELSSGLCDDAGWWSAATCLGCADVAAIAITGEREIGKLWASLDVDDVLIAVAGWPGLALLSDLGAAKLREQWLLWCERQEREEEKMKAWRLARGSH